MQRQHKIRLWKSSIKTVGQHRFRAVDRFLRRLGYEDQSASPSIFHLGQQFGRAEEAGHVNVVTTRVHDTGFLPRIVFCLYRAGIGQTCFFFDGERVQLSAYPNCRSVAILHERNHAIALPVRLIVFADVFSDGVAQHSQLLSNERGCLRFIVRKFRRRVQRLVRADKLRQFAIDERVE